MPDTGRVKRYLFGVSRGVTDYCPSCQASRRVWNAETEGGEIITACGTCQRIVKREPLPAAPQAEAV